jgi:hypothetical protein
MLLHEKPLKIYLKFEIGFAFIRQGNEIVTPLTTKNTRLNLNVYLNKRFKNFKFALPA